MSINHYSSEIPEALWWQQEQSHHHHHMMEPSRNNNIHNSTNSAAASFWSHHLPPAYIRNSANFSFDLNNEDDEETDEQQLTDERENTSSSNNNNIVRENEESAEVHLNREIEIMPKLSLFEKPLTPSDVGKLNRLVIPKQYAEKYFPLNNGGNNESGEKGLLLSFEDELGKPWRFRYSYWNSSQSYVLTKGWSRFVKEKKLGAGDIVLFERHPIDGDRLFIGWRRRSAAAEVSENSGVGHAAAVAGGSGGGGWTRLFFPGHPYPVQTQQGLGHANPYQPDCLHAASVLQNQTPPPSSVNANSKRFRLFGVNMDLGCQPDDSEPPTPEDGSSLSSHGQAHYHQYQYHSDPKLYSYNHQNQMDINLSRDVTQTRYHQG